MRPIILVLSALFILGCTGQEAPPPSDGSCTPSCHVSLEQGWEPSCHEGPLICTMEYRLGDYCMRYLSCEKSDGKCNVVLRPEYGDCISCFRDCQEENAGSAVFENCEEKCKNR